MDYFNEKEREKQKKFASWRDKFFSNLIRFLVEKNINQNTISFIGVVFLILACVINPKYVFLVAILLILYIFFDAIDGGVARYKNEQSSTGSLIDIICDQMGVVLISCAFIHYYDVNYVAYFIFSNFYVFFIILVVFLNEKKVNIFAFIRVKYIYFLLYVFSSFIPLVIIDIFVISFSFYYVIVFILALRLMIENDNLI